MSISSVVCVVIGAIIGLLFLISPFLTRRMDGFGGLFGWLFDKSKTKNTPPSGRDALVGTADTKGITQLEEKELKIPFNPFRDKTSVNVGDKTVPLPDGVKDTDVTSIIDAVAAPAEVSEGPNNVKSLDLSDFITRMENLKRTQDEKNTD